MDCWLGICLCPDDLHEKHVLDVNALDKLIPESKTPVVLSRPIAQRILAALEWEASFHDDRPRRQRHAELEALAAELRSRVLTKDRQEVP